MNKMKKVIGEIVIKILLVCSLLIFSNCGNKSSFEVETYTVKRGDFLHTVTETGELEAVNALTISAPMIPWDLGSLKITQIVEDGDEVKEGDVLVEFDKAEVRRSMENAQSELEIAQAELRKAIASQKSQIEEMEADLEKARLQNRIAQLNLELAGYKSAIERKKIELQLNNAIIDLQRAEENLENQKKINRQEINKLQLKVHQAQTKLEEAEATLDKLTVKAPAPGIAIIEKNWDTGNKFQTDDQAWRGQRLIQLPDLSTMQAKVMINEVDISKIDTAQTANIKLDAYPDTTFKSHVSDVAALARNKDRDSKVKIFDVMLLLDERNDKLMPGLTVSCEILIDKIADTLFIPIEAVFKNEEGTYVYLKDNGGFEAVPIETGQENDDYVIVVKGLSEDDQIALVDPTLELYEKQDKKEKQGSL